MIFTQEQFKKITGEHDYIYIDDLPFETLGLEFFNGLPEHLQGEILQWGYDDTVVRENLFEFMVKNQFGMTIKEYYNSDLFKDYIENGKLIPFDLSRLTKKETKTPDDNLSDTLKSLNSVNEYLGDILKKYEDLPVYINNVLQEIPKDPEYSEKVLLFDGEYNGFESFFDFDRDMTELLSFENKKKIPPDFLGRIKVLIEYYPTKEDIEKIKNL